METKWFGGSMVAWLAMAASLVASAITYGATTATTAGKIAQLEYIVTRNREDMVERIKSAEGSIANVYGSLVALNSIKIDVEVIKVQMKSINDAIQRIEADTRTRRLK